MRIAFTGHRNKVTYNTDLLSIVLDVDDGINSVWVHGGAQGFDTQVEAFAKTYDIKTIVYRPDYNKYGRRAPLVRNKLIVEGADLLVACWDGRNSGGTHYTIRLAKELGVPIKVLPAIRNK